MSFTSFNQSSSNLYLKKLYSKFSIPLFKSTKYLPIAVLNNILENKNFCFKIFPLK